MLCYRCGSHVPDGTEACGTCGQKFALGLKPGPIAGFGTGTRRHRIAVESSPYKIGDVLAGRYEIKDNVGAGPVGWVFKCLDRDIDVDVSLKVVSPRFLQTADERRHLSKELRTIRKLSHPNIVRVYEDGEDQERLFFTMQHLEGLTLRRIWDLRRQKGQLFAVREVEPIVQQIAQALDYAHATTAHGDLKPDNILILPDLLKITDFGLATALPRAPFMAAQKTGGVHRYVAPEFLHGERIDPRVDVFSLGVVLGEMLAGVPFEGSQFDLLARNPNVPNEVDQVFRKAVAFKPEDRFASAGEFAGALTEASGGPKAKAAPKAVAPAAPPPQPAAVAPPVAPKAPTPPPVAPKPVPAPAPQAAPPPVAPKAPTAPVSPVAVPKNAGDVSVRELTEDISEEDIEEEVRTVIEARPRRGSSDDDKPTSKVDIRSMPTPPSTKKVEPAKAPEKKPEPAKDPKKADAKAPEKKPEPAKDPKKPDAKDQKKPDSRADSKKDAAPAKGPSKGDPAWSGGAPLPPPKEPPKQPAPPPPDRRPYYIAAVLIAVIVGASIVMVMNENGGVAVRPPPSEPAVVEATPAPVPDAATEQPAEPDAGAPVAVATNDPAAAPPAETKPPEPAPVVERPKTKAELRAEKAAADRAAREEARRLAEEKRALAKEEARRKAEEAKSSKSTLDGEERRRRQDEALARLSAEKAEAERLAKERAETDRLAREKAAADRAAAEKAIAEKAVAEKAVAEKAAADKLAAEKAAADKARVASAAGAGETTTASSGGTTCPGGMRFIPSGTFRFGAPDSDDLKNFGDFDVEEVKLDGYCIDIYEYPNRAKLKPTTGMGWKQASDACRAQKKRLCREQEWERACKGPGGARFPYGKNFDPDACNTEDADGSARDLEPSGSFSKCISGFGLYDMAGNVAEWTDSLYEEGGSDRTAKGGAADRPDFATRCAARAKKSPAAKEKLLGFRCCADPK